MPSQDMPNTKKADLKPSFLDEVAFSERTDDRRRLPPNPFRSECARLVIIPDLRLCEGPVSGLAQEGIAEKVAFCDLNRLAERNS